MGDHDSSVDAGTLDIDVDVDLDVDVVVDPFCVQADSV